MPESTRRDFLANAALAGIGAIALPILSTTEARAAASQEKKMTTTPEQRIAVVRDYLDHVLNGHDAAAVTDFFTADAEWHGGSLGTVKGAQNIVGLMGALIGGLPDIQATTQDVIASGDLVAMRFVATGTQTGDLLGIPKTGKSVKWDSVDIYRVTDEGKISTQWSFQDMAAIMSQLGAVKLPWAG